MPSQTSWLLQNRVIYLYTSGIMTIQNFETANQSIHQFIQDGVASGTEKIHLLINTTDVQKPPNVLEVLRVMSFLYDPHLGWVVVGGVRNPMINFFVRLLGQVTSRQIAIFPTPDPALELLNSKDPTLPDLKHIFHDKVST